MVKDIPKIWSTIAPLAKDKVRAAVEITCQYKAEDIRYKYLHISCMVVGLIINLDFHI